MVSRKPTEYGRAYTSNTLKEWEAAARILMDGGKHMHTYHYVEGQQGNQGLRYSLIINV